MDFRTDVVIVGTGVWFYLHEYENDREIRRSL
jgi:hypothetical protein